MRRIMFGLAAVLLAIASLSTAASARAQDLTVDLPIVAFTCPSDPGDVSLARGNIPAECEEVAGVAFTVRAEDGSVLGTCTTDASGSCRVTVPAPDGPTPVLVVEDVETVPAGYVPRENPVESFIGVPEAEAVVINLPADQPPSETIGLIIDKVNCPSAADFEAGRENCELGVGVTFEVTTAEGEVLGTCTTEAMTIQTEEVAACIVLVPRGATVVVTEDLSTAPTGYAPMENPQTVTVRGDYPTPPDYTPRAVFVNLLVVGEEPPTDGEEPPVEDVPADEDSDGDDDTATVPNTVALPNTGVGPMASAADADRLVLLSAALALVFGALAASTRRRLPR